MNVRLSLLATTKMPAAFSTPASAKRIALNMERNSHAWTVTSVSYRAKSSVAALENEMWLWLLALAGRFKGCFYQPLRGTCKIEDGLTSQLGEYHNKIITLVYKQFTMTVLVPLFRRN